MTPHGWTLARVGGAAGAGGGEQDDGDDDDDSVVQRGPDSIPFRWQQSREAAAYTSASSVLEGIGLSKSLRDPRRAAYTASLLGELVAKGASDDGAAMSASCWRLVEAALTSRAFSKLLARHTNAAVIAAREAVRRCAADAARDDPTQSGVATLTAPPQGNRLSLATSVRVVEAFEGKTSLPDEVHSQGWAGRRATAGDTLQAIVAFSSRYRAVPAITLEASVDAATDAPRPPSSSEHRPNVVAVDRSGFVVAMPRPSPQTHAVMVEWMARPGEGPAPDPHPVVLRRVVFLREWLHARGVGGGGGADYGGGGGGGSGGGAGGAVMDEAAHGASGDSLSITAKEGDASDGRTCLMDLPNETLEHICSFFLDDEPLRAFALTCTRAHDVCMEGGVWRALCVRQFGAGEAAWVSRELRLEHARDARWLRAHTALRWRADATSESLTLCRDEGKLMWSAGRDRLRRAGRHVTSRELVRLIPW
jgi:hypothetical protein